MPFEDADDDRWLLPRRNPPINPPRRALFESSSWPLLEPLLCRFANRENNPRLPVLWVLELSDGGGLSRRLLLVL